jgi:hypothetical protein
MLAFVPEETSVTRLTATPNQMDQPYTWSVLIAAGTPTPSQGAPPLELSIVATAERTTDGVILTADYADEDGYGATIDEALADLLTSIWDRYRALRSQQSLAPPEQGILTRLSALYNE